MAQAVKPTSIETPTGRIYQGSTRDHVKLSTLESQGYRIVECTMSNAEINLRDLGSNEIILVNESMMNAQTSYLGDNFAKNPKVYFTEE